MNFDKSKTMRNAERFLSQGKIQAAISEYRQIVEHDKKDFNTLNLLGDLYVKSSDTQNAVECFTKVADHYAKQGFAQKAIAIYQKIARLQPDEPRVTENLAQLYHARGSIVEARDHYAQVAGYYEQNGQKLEALNTWKQIASIDPNNTEIYLKIAAAYSEENQFESAVESYIGAGLRFAERGQDERAIVAFGKALEIDPESLDARRGSVKSQIKLGFADEAIVSLEEILESQPNNRELNFLLVDCYLDLGETQKAEQIVLKIIEKEPANYPKLLDFLKIYLKNGDTDSAVRILMLTAENLLAGGQGKDFYGWLEEILARSPENISALRLLVRYHSWQRNELEMKTALERLVEAANHEEAFEDERYALTQLTILAPQESKYSNRLQEINAEHGVLPVMAETFSSSSDNDSSIHGEYEPAAATFESFENYQSKALVEEAYSSQFSGEKFEDDSEQVTDFVILPEPNAEHFKLTDQMRFAQELESIEFYLTQDYHDLAEKYLDALESEFGSRSEIAELRERLNNLSEAKRGIIGDAEIGVEETAQNAASADFSSDGFRADDYNDFTDFRSDLNLEETEPNADAGDYETHYQLAVAYQEMGLTEDAIREYQEAIGLVKTDDGTRRFFSCANLLGHCFMEKQMPNLALMWFNRAMNTADLNEAERLGLLYELGNASEIGGDYEKATEYFEQIYAVDVDHRNVAKRLESLREHNFLRD